MEGWETVSKAVIYASTFGKTRKTAKYLADQLGADTFDLKKQMLINMAEYDHIVLGSGIHAGKPYKRLVEFIGNNKGELSKKRVSLFLCCKFNDEKGAAQCRNIADEFGISDATFFSGRGDKNPDGFEVALDEYVSRLR
ncbi:MAG: flavodoxin domain-containing protein [Candidatus Methanoplasma sp.]|jgi:menaquinone-dependent protoporphyrinogen oxidase|nr:flavodoxin domain-containing protein [Candidatus Methanoplasma sp.]